MELIQNLDSNCEPCSNCTKLTGCADGVPYMELINLSGGTSVVTWVNLINGSVSTTAPANFAVGACPPEIDVDILSDCDGTTTSTVQALDRVSVVGNENPLYVRILENCEDDIKVDVEYVCNEVTNVYDQITTTVTNGVPGTPVITATTIVCDENPDIEQRTYCDLTTGTLWNVVSSFDELGAETVISSTNLNIDCTPTTVTQEFELVCNSTTNVYDLYQWTITDGVASIPVITATTTPCDEDKPDYKIRKTCSAVTNTIQEQLVSIVGGVESNIGTSVDTGIPCISSKLDQIHVLQTGTGNIPAGFKSVTINNITGTTIVAGGYELGQGRRDNSISLNATTVAPVRGILPAITITGGTFQWIGVLPINEI